MSLLADTLALHPGTVRASAAVALDLADSSDPDVRWAVLRVVAAVGHPCAQVPPDLVEVRERARHARLVAGVKAERYVRIGDPYPPQVKYVAVAIWPAPAGEVVFLFPAPPAGERYLLDPSMPAVLLGGRRVPWPPFEPPLLSLLVSEDPDERNRSGFVAERLVVAGDARLPSDVAVRVGS